jgi:anti-sigma B factor antagonist
MNFAVNTEVVDEGIAVIDLKGEVDLYTAPEFKQHLLGQVENGVLKVIDDFTDTTLIESTTLGVLVGGVKRLRPVGGQLLLVCSDRNIIKIFEITGLHRVFEIHGTRVEALEAARAATPTA